LAVVSITERPRVAVVTGAASGIGRAAVNRLHADGWAVLGVDLDAEALGSIGDLGEQAGACIADISTEDGNAAMVSTAIARYGALDGLVLNAGLGTAGSIESQSIDDLDRVLAVNVRGAILGLRAALPALRAGDRSAVVVTASVSGMHGDPGMWAYNTSKGGILNFARAAAIDLGREGIRVNAVCPGPIGGTRMTEPLERHAPDLYEEMRSHVPLERFGRPEEVAATIAWLLSDDASYVTGVALPVDGGVTASTGMMRPRFGSD
jgi:NAD(P)-dependent dehydrogenase (short-subunit alcohol dehydrogenase family)